MGGRVTKGPDRGHETLDADDFPAAPRSDIVTFTGVTRGSAMGKIHVHEFITLDGGTGEIMLGVVPTVQPELSGDFAELMGELER